jgi:hypothetical protein
LSFVEEIVEGTGISREYTGDLGRYLPPKGVRPQPEKRGTCIGSVL